MSSFLLHHVTIMNICANQILLLLLMTVTSQPNQVAHCKLWCESGNLTTFDLALSSYDHDDFDDHYDHHGGDYHHDDDDDTDLQQGIPSFPLSFVTDSTQAMSPPSKDSRRSSIILITCHDKTNDDEEDDDEDDDEDDEDDEDDDLIIIGKGGSCKPVQLLGVCLHIVQQWWVVSESIITSSSSVITIIQPPLKPQSNHHDDLRCTSIHAISLL